MFALNTDIVHQSSPLIRTGRKGKAFFLPIWEFFLERMTLFSEDDQSSHWHLEPLGV